MNANIVLTMSGPDRIGIVEEITKLLLDLGGNVETSRMTRLGGEFAVLMLVSLSPEQLAEMDNVVASLTANGYMTTISRVGHSYAESHPDWISYQIEVRGADHEGIIHQVTQYLSRRGINIESMDTETSRAPVSGTPLFSMTALVAVPPSVAAQNWEAALRDVGRDLNVDIKVNEVRGD